MDIPGREELDEDSDEIPMVEGDVDVARQVFDRAYRDLKGKGLKAEVRCHHLLGMEKWV